MARGGTTRTVVEASPLGVAAGRRSTAASALTRARDLQARRPRRGVRPRALAADAGARRSTSRSARRTSPRGSGFVIDGEGHLLTNAHVVAGATDIRVTFSDQQTVAARVLGKDEDSDLARARASSPRGSTCSPLELGDSASVQVGDPTVAIGNPFGLDRTLTTGVVSAKQRRITAPSGFSIDNVHPDRRGDQPRQLRRPADRRRRPRDRDQLPDRHRRLGRQRRASASPCRSTPRRR